MTAVDGTETEKGTFGRGLSAPLYFAGAASGSSFSSSFELAVASSDESAAASVDAGDGSGAAAVAEGGTDSVAVAGAVAAGVPVDGPVSAWDAPPQPVASRSRSVLRRRMAYSHTTDRRLTFLPFPRSLGRPAPLTGRTRASPGRGPRTSCT